jgi:hypothetical protein
MGSFGGGGIQDIAAVQSDLEPRGQPCRRPIVCFLVNDDDRSLRADYEKWLEEWTPHAAVSQYEHNRTGQACLGEAAVLNEVTGMPARI